MPPIVSPAPPSTPQHPSCHHFSPVCPTSLKHIPQTHPPVDPSLLSISPVPSSLPWYSLYCAQSLSGYASPPPLSPTLFPVPPSLFPPRCLPMHPSPSVGEISVLPSVSQHVPESFPVSSPVFPVSPSRSQSPPSVPPWGTWGCMGTWAHTGDMLVVLMGTHWGYEDT